jgi:hypothetical protein
LVWEEWCKGAANKHATSKVAHDGFRLDVEITEHLIATPPTQETDDVGIHLGTE